MVSTKNYLFKLFVSMKKRIIKFMMKKLIIVGNGFDYLIIFLHPINILEKHIQKMNICKSLKKFIISMQSEFCDNTKWYEFESSIENVAGAIFSRQFDDSSNSEKYIMLEKKMEDCNALFKEIKELLKIYLADVTKNREVRKKESLMKEFKSEQTYVVSFNYTDIIKYYSNKVDYIHGSLSDDLDVILGFSNDIPSMDLASGAYIRYMKEVQKFNLKYLRFLKTNRETEKLKERLKEFKPHLDCLFSGKSGWAFPIRNIEGKQEYDVSKAYPSLSRFYKDNKELNFNSFSKYKHV